MSRKAAVISGGQEKALGDLKPGHAVTISYESSLEVVTKFEAADAPATGNLWFIVMDIVANGDCTMATGPRPCPADHEVNGDRLDVASLPGAVVTKRRDATVWMQHDFAEGGLSAFYDHGQVSVNGGTLVLEPKAGDPYAGKWAFAEYSKRLRPPVHIALGVKEFGRNTLVSQLSITATDEQLVLNLAPKDGQDVFTQSASWRKGTG